VNMSEFVRSLNVDSAQFTLVTLQGRGNGHPFPSSCSDWSETLIDMLGDETLSALRLNTHRGRPLGSDAFLSKIEALLGRRLRPLPVGRPRKRKRK